MSNLTEPNLPNGETAPDELLAPLVPDLGAIAKAQSEAADRAIESGKASEARAIAAVDASLSPNGIRPRFAALVAALPADLSGFDLTPLYAEAASNAEEKAVKELERAWTPTPAQTLATAFPGPVGELHQSNNLRKWQAAQTAAAVETHGAALAAIHSRLLADLAENGLSLGLLLAFHNAR